MKMKTHMASTMYSKVPNCQGGQNRQGVGTLEEINKLESWNKWGGGGRNIALKSMIIVL